MLQQGMSDIIRQVSTFGTDAILILLQKISNNEIVNNNIQRFGTEY